MKELIKLIDRITGHFFVRILFGFGLYYYFSVKYRDKVIVIGKENLPKNPSRVLFYANHQTMMDPLLLLARLFFLSCILRERSLPSTPAAAENWFPDNCRRVRYLEHIPIVKDSKLLAWLMRHGHAFPVKEGRRDSGAQKEMIRLINEGNNVLIFPEGTRSEDGKLGSFRPGVAMLFDVCNFNAVHPILIFGAREILPKGQRWPDWSGGSKIVIVVGKCIMKKLVKEQREVRRLERIENFVSDLKLVKRYRRFKLLKVMREELESLRRSIAHI